MNTTYLLILPIAVLVVALAYGQVCIYRKRKAAARLADWERRMMAARCPEDYQTLLNEMEGVVITNPPDRIWYQKIRHKCRRRAARRPAHTLAAEFEGRQDGRHR